MNQPAPKIEENILWIDLEMTGLDPARDSIIEIAALVTDGELEVVAEGPDLVIHQPDELLAAMDAWNTKHHGESGLTELVRESTLTMEQADALMFEFVSAHTERGLAPLAGNSVHQDRVFLARYLPRFHAWLHYRNIDVSTLKELVLRWYPEIYKRRPKKHGEHRARGDIIDSIEELRYYRQSVLRERGAAT
jgi:oligoribonuclease